MRSWLLMFVDNFDKITIVLTMLSINDNTVKMYRLVFIEVLVILCVVSAGFGEDVTKTCEVTVQDTNSWTLNCSRRNLDEVPAWPEEMRSVDNDGHVLINFFNNSITTISQLDPVPGDRIALSFKDNELVEIEDEAFSNIDRLVYLDLSSNRISGDVLRSEIFHGQYKNGTYGNIALETLNLGDNQIHSLDRYLFQYTPNLTRLYLNNNPLEILDHVTILAISSATNLEVLDLANTEIDNIPLDAFRGLLNLEHLDLSDNKFITVPESLSLVGNTLKYLTFNNNPIVELNDDSFVGLTSLIDLEVGENEYLEEVKRSTFTPLKNLKVLHLCHNEKLRYISHLAFRGLKDKWTLKEVYLNENDLSELSTDLMPWEKLDIIGMTGNKWLCNCDLANIVARQGAGAKFKPNEIPYCESPMKMKGTYITNISLSNCHSIGYSEKRSFSLTDLKPKHVLWSIFGVGMVVLLGMLIGLTFNGFKNIYHTKIRSQPIRYVNLNSDSTFSLA